MIGSDRCYDHQQTKRQKRGGAEGAFLDKLCELILSGLPITKLPTSNTDHRAHDLNAAMRIIEAKMGIIRKVDAGVTSFREIPDKQNTGKPVGVYFCPKNTKRPWYAQISFNKKRLTFGGYATAAEASAKRTEFIESTKHIKQRYT